MLFNSINFLLFFPIVVLVYFVISHPFRYIWLLISSYYFYMCWNPKYALLMATSTIITYVSGLLIDYSNGIEDEKKREFQKKLWVFLSFAFNLSILFFFKYFDFAVSNLSGIMSAVGVQFIVPTFDVVLPVGISFYTFQALSYTMDVYRKDIPAEKNIAKYALFVSFFPQLVAGPIERSKNLLNQFNEKHYFDYDRVTKGLQLMLWGYFQKLVIADHVALLVNQVYNNYNDYAGFEIILAAVLFSVQVYCDFSSYSDIAIGAAQVMGFRLMQNFRQPYFADSVSDFWRRWHISLSTWFRDYLYIPLGGNRKGKLREYFNIMVVFLASGLWHGASWNYVIWGLLNGMYQVLGKILQPFRDWVVALFKIDRNAFSHRLYKIVTTFFLVCFAFIFFRSKSAMDAFLIIKRIFMEFNPQIFFNGAIYAMGLDKIDLSLVIFSLGVLIIVSYMRYNGVSMRNTIAKQGLWFRWSLYIVCIYFVLFAALATIGSPVQEFIYFQF